MLRWIILGLLLFSGSLLTVKAEDEAVVENEEIKIDNLNNDEIPLTEGTAEGPLSLSSPDADTVLYFINPAGSKDIPTNEAIRLLIGFRNKGQQGMMVDWLDASLRYPMDYNYIITNLTSIRYSHEVLPGEEASLSYGFYLSDAFHSRPFILNINLHYHDANGKMYISSVFNDTINVYENEEGFDSQTFFLYVIFAAAVVLVVVAIQQYFAGKQRKRPTKRATTTSTLETGSSKTNDVDFEWLPESTLRQIGKSPKKTPTQSRSPQQSPKAAKKRD